MARIAVLLGPDFEDAEFDVPRRVLLEHGHQVDVIGRDTDTELVGKRNDVRHTAEVAVDDADVADYDAVVVPGGYSPDKLRTDGRMVSFLRAADEAALPVAAICHAGSLLIEADVVRGRTMTSWPSIKTDLVNAGAHWVDEEVVTDGRYISSRKPDDLPAFCDALLGALDGNGG